MFSIFPVTNLSNKGKKKEVGWKQKGKKDGGERDKGEREGKGTEALDRVPEQELVEKRMNQGWLKFLSQYSSTRGLSHASSFHLSTSSNFPVSFMFIKRKKKIPIVSLY